MAWLRLILRDFAEEMAQKVEERKLEKEVSRDLDPTYWMPGNPATFATAGEKPWKLILARHIPTSSGSTVYGLDMQFFLKSISPRGHPVDIDNLCEPVFSVLINQLQWFNGKRNNIQWFCASKTQSPDSGLKLTLFTKPSIEINLGEVKLTPVFEQVYTGNMPNSASDTVFARWVDKHTTGHLSLANVTVLLRFGDVRINLGDIATGKLKPILDGLYPLLGGNPGAPEDWKIQTLAVEKGTRNLTPNSVSVTVWEAV